MKNILLLCLMIVVSSCFAQRTGFKHITEKDGYVGIGTNSPDEMLTVKGKIHTQEVIVDLNGAVAPDYVFQSYFEGSSNLMPEYKLPSIEEVANYVAEYHHLPGIPSAAVIEEEGLSLKEMNLLLLQKIEELTIYTIQQQQEIDILKKLVNSQTD